jgi:hypothetical protein
MLYPQVTELVRAGHVNRLAPAPPRELLAPPRPSTIGIKLVRKPVLRHELRRRVAL